MLGPWVPGVVLWIITHLKEITIGLLFLAIGLTVGIYSQQVNVLEQKLESMETLATASTMVEEAEGEAHGAAMDAAVAKGNEWRAAIAGHEARVMEAARTAATKEEGREIYNEGMRRLRHAKTPADLR